MKVIILGNGLLGQSIKDEMPDAVMVGHDRVDVRDYDSVVMLLRDEQPDVAINTVALHSLPACEGNAALAFDINARGAERVASLVPTVYISTDYVFSDGGPHDESLPGRQPRSVYGRSKLAGELATLEQDGIVVRVSGLYHHEYESHKGKSFPERVATTYDDMKFPTDQVFSPTYAPDAAGRIARLARNLADDPSLLLFEQDMGYDAPNGIYHAANAGSVSWHGFASEILQALGRRYKVKPFEAKDPLRPTNSALKSTRLPPLRHWIVGLEDWVTARQKVIERNRVSPLRSEA
jgi:dTDP-4-dehydrorhamnose reductase